MQHSAEKHSNASKEINDQFEFISGLKDSCYDVLFSKDLVENLSRLQQELEMETTDPDSNSTFKILIARYPHEFKDGRLKEYSEITALHKLAEMDQNAIKECVEALRSDFETRSQEILNDFQGLGFGGSPDLLEQNIQKHPCLMQLLYLKMLPLKESTFEYDDEQIKSVATITEDLGVETENDVTDDTFDEDEVAEENYTTVAKSLKTTAFLYSNSNDMSKLEKGRHVLDLLEKTNEYYEKHGEDQDIIQLLQMTENLLQGDSTPQDAPQYDQLVQKISGKPSGGWKIASIALIVFGVFTLPLIPVGILAVVAGGALLKNKGLPHGPSKAARTVEFDFFPKAKRQHVNVEEQSLLDNSAQSVDDLPDSNSQIGDLSST